GWGVLTITLPQESYSFVGYGNIIKTGGIDFFEYRQQPIWTPDVWKALTVLGALLAALMLAKMTGSLLSWLGDRRRGVLASQFRLSPVTGFYLVGMATFAVSLGFLGYLFDRYTLGFIPFVILFMVRGSS